MNKAGFEINKCHIINKHSKTGENMNSYFKRLNLINP